MKPSIGRVVHFYTLDRSKWSNGQASGPYKADIIQGPFSPDSPTHSTMVNLRVSNYDGDYTEGSVCEKEQAMANGDTQRWWVWPPRE